MCTVCVPNMIFSNNILYDFIFGKFIVLMYGIHIYVWVFVCEAVIYFYIFFCYFEITKHLEGIFIVFSTEVACFI